MGDTDLTLRDLGGNSLDGRHSFLSGQNGVLQHRLRVCLACYMCGITQRQSGTYFESFVEGGLAGVFFLEDLFVVS